MRLGIDFGTTNSAVSLYDGERLITIPVDSENENPDVLPSLVYIDREYLSTEGIQAAFQYQERETGRRVQWQKRFLGQVEMVVAGSGDSPIRYLHDLHALVDIAANGRLLQSVKTALRFPTYDGTRIFDRFYTIDMIILRLLSKLKERAEQALGEECTEIVLGRPVRFSHDSYVDRRAEEILYKAARFAGFEEINFALEPLAVAHLQHVSSNERQTVLVFDFGGGTLDLTVAEIGGSKDPNILATRGVLVGGDDLDKRIMVHLTKYFGRDTRVGRDRAPFPFDMLELLEGWQTMTGLSQTHYMGRIKAFQKDSSDPIAMRNLEYLVSRNLGYTLFREIERCKRELSSEFFTKLEFKHGPINIQEVITRENFNRMIAKELESSEEGIHKVMDQAGVSADQIDVVLRTGGSSQVLAFKEMLARIFGEEKVQELDPMVSVVGGMAVIARRDGLPKPEWVVRYGDDLPVSDLQTKGAVPYEVYRLQIGEKAYVDDDFTISRCPAKLSGLPTFRTANRADVEAKDSEFLTFELWRPARIYIGFDPMASHRPDWMADFEPFEQQVEVIEEWRGERALPLYYKDFQAGTITFGGNKARGFQSGTPVLTYIVIIQEELNTPDPVK